ncbi:saccharopine dehydrogenase C-terminal domain-containing protein [bacterium]
MKNKESAKIVCLGTGMVGSVMVRDLAQNPDFQVTAVDRDQEALEKLKAEGPVKIVQADLQDMDRLSELIQDCDFVVNAVPGFMGFSTLKQLIEAGKNVVDIAFFPEDAFLLDDLAKSKGVTAVVDCGVAPGMSNLILGYHNQHMEIDFFECLVGGLPMKRSWPYEYKAPFSPIDVLEEYTRPARFVENGEIVTRPALSEPELVDLDPVGTLEAFNSDGLRSLIRTMQIPNMKEKTMRYPGHANLMRILRETGFLNDDLIEIDGHLIRPLDLTTKLLFPIWKLEANEKEFTIMRIVIRGMENGKRKEIIYHLFDQTDPATGFSSMARTTGFACTAAVHLVANGEFTRKGISPPEFVGAEAGCFDKMMAYQEARQVMYRKEEREL